MGALSTFPVSFKVKGKRIVVVGGGDEAVAKVRLAVKTRAEVHVVSRRLISDFSEFQVKLAERPFVPDDLAGAALVFVADQGEDGELAKREARRRRIPLNVVDVPEECDFYTPAIVDRAPVTVAISSEGDAPVLARLLRAKIEAMLSPDFGAVARLAGELRDRAVRLLPDGSARRRFFEALVTSPRIERVAGTDVHAARREALRLLDAHASGAKGEGRVWLIGAGPGAEDLLTLRAQRLLQEADVVVYESVVPEAIVQMGRRDAERVLLPSGMKQSLINRLLEDLAAQGKRVARLYAGDAASGTAVLAEIEALQGARIDHAVVPGVNAADAVTAATIRVA